MGKRQELEDFTVDQVAAVATIALLGTAALITMGVQATEAIKARFGKERLSL